MANKKQRNLAKTTKRINECIANQSNLLDLTGLGIKNLADFLQLFKCHHVKSLYLYHNRISNLKGLSALTGLTQLRLNCNYISNIEPLDALTKLKGLHLYNNKIADICALSGLTNL